jgi:hypothetical protein
MAGPCAGQPGGPGCCSSRRARVPGSLAGRTSRVSPRGLAASAPACARGDGLPSCRAVPQRHRSRDPMAPPRPQWAVPLLFVLGTRASRLVRIPGQYGIRTGPRAPGAPFRTGHPGVKRASWVSQQANGGGACCACCGPMMSRCADAARLAPPDFRLGRSPLGRRHCRGRGFRRQQPLAREPAILRQPLSLTILSLLRGRWSAATSCRSSASTTSHSTYASLPALPARPATVRAPHRHPGPPPGPATRARHPGPQ